MPAPPPIFVISLAGSPRRSGMAERLAPWPGAWSFVDAVDGNALVPAKLKQVYDDALTVRALGRSLSRPEIGCALSHRRVYERILDSGLDSAIVLEDDAIPKQEFFQIPFAGINFTFDIVSFYTKALVRRKAERALGEVKLHRAAGSALYTVGYLVSAQGAARLHAATQPIHNVADWPVPPEHLEFYVAAANLLQHPRGSSLIEASRARFGRHASNRCSRLENIVGNGNIQYLTAPLFIKYFVRRKKYLGIRDYMRREIVREVKSKLPRFYMNLNHEKPQTATG